MKVSAWAGVLFRKSKVISLRLVEVFLRDLFEIPVAVIEIRGEFLVNHLVGGIAKDILEPGSSTCVNNTISAWECAF